MKKHLTLFVLIVVSCGSVFSEETEKPSEPTLRSRLYAIGYDDLVHNLPSLQKQAAETTLSERKQLYDHFEKPLWPVVLNLIPGFGTGSFVQGDNGFGTGLLIGTVLSDGVAVVGFGSLLLGIASIAGSFDGRSSSSGGQYFETGQRLVLIGGIGELAMWGIGLFRGTYYPLSYNSKLSESLLLDTSP